MTLIILILVVGGIAWAVLARRKRKRDAEYHAAIQEYLRQYREATERDSL